MTKGSTEQVHSGELAVLPSVGPATLGHCLLLFITSSQTAAVLAEPPSC